MRFLTGLALTLGFWGLLCAFFGGFIFFVFWITSFIPLIGMGLIRFRGHLPKGGYDVQTNGRYAQTPAAASAI